MPITLGPLSRRRFLGMTVAGTASAILSRSVLADDGQADPNYFLLFSDIHLDANKDYVHISPTGVTRMYANFQQAVREALALPMRPAAALVNGDVAFLLGHVEDYSTAAEAMRPLREAGIPVHWAMGNHDDRVNAATMAAADRTIVNDVNGRRIMVLETPLADIFVMDSLLVTDKSPGLLGPRQLGWLGAALDSRPDRPVIVFVHHNPYLMEITTQPVGDGSRLQDYVLSQELLAARTQPSTRPGIANLNLLDTLPLLKVLLPRRHVKAYIFGHSHRYSHQVIDGMHLVNLPATAYIFNPGQPLGWMDMRIKGDGARLELHCLDHNHRLQGDVLSLRWRA